jgi:Carboxypeptidase regulatory-like domain
MRTVLRLGPLLLILLICLPLAAQDSAQPSFGMGRMGHRRYSLSGTLYDATDHRAIDGAKVELRLLAGSTVATAFAGVGGNFAFSNLGSGAYYIVVEAVGYAPINQQVSLEDSAFGLQI